MKFIWNFQDENMKKSGASQGQSASELISKRIAELGDWRGKTLGRMRKLIKKADPDVVEEWKWVKPTKPGTPVWSHGGIICTGESYKNVVKLTFAKGASLKDPARLFNSSLEGNVRRAIDIQEGEEVDESAFTTLVRQAVALNSSRKSKPSKKGKPAAAASGVRSAARAQPPRRREALGAGGPPPRTPPAPPSARPAPRHDGRRQAHPFGSHRKAIRGEPDPLTYAALSQSSQPQDQR